MAALEAGCPWQLEIFETIGSTSDYLIGKAEQGAAEGSAALAYLQTKGRGSRGRTWVAPAGNLNLSVLFRPVGRVDTASWALMAAVAFYDALSEAAPQAALRLKWPNDVLLGGRKLAGLLIETAQEADGACRWLVIGMGANLCHTPPDMQRPLACLAEIGPPPSPDLVAEKLLDALFRWRAESLAAIRAAWLERAHPIGTELLITGPDVRGQFAGLDDDGALLLRLPDGATQRFHSGELVFAASAAPASRA